jgi:hypothetical protein
VKAVCGVEGVEGVDDAVLIAGRQRGLYEQRVVDTSTQVVIRC